MKGLELCRKYYDHCRPILLREIPEIMASAAIGLVGEGSECFGLDDGLSLDHDFGPAFCLWLPDAMLARHHDQIERAFSLLPSEFGGYAARMRPNLRNGRVGPMGIQAFFAFFTDLAKPPANWRQWLSLNETRLAAAVNGEIFDDSLGEFTAWRKSLQAYYPRDVWLKKIAARVMTMAQAGQYNLPRTLERRDAGAAMLACARFSEAALSLVFLFNHTYMPYYKLAPRACRLLPVLGTELSELLEFLAGQPLRDRRDLDVTGEIERFCGACAAHLRATGLSNEMDDWLWAHGPRIMDHVKTPELLRMNILEA